MKLQTEHSPASFWPLPTQRFLAQWRCGLAGLHRATTAALRMALALAMAAAITACGPGTGGTGVGPLSGTYVSVNSANTSTAAMPGTVPGAIDGAGAYVLVLEPPAIRLTGACLAFQFDGAWVEANGEIRVTGSYRQAAPASDLVLAPAQAGTLVAKVQSTGLAVTLQDARGAVVLSFATGAKLADGVAVVSAPGCKSLPAVSTP